jgi:hypothetical protein
MFTVRSPEEKKYLFKPSANPGKEAPVERARGKRGFKSETELRLGHPVPSDERTEPGSSCESTGAAMKTSANRAKFAQTNPLTFPDFVEIDQNWFQQAISEPVRGGIKAPSGPLEKQLLRSICVIPRSE